MIMSVKSYRQVNTMLKLYAYRLRALEGLRAEYAEVEQELSVQAQAYGVFPPSAGEHSDPVAARYAHMEKVRVRIAFDESQVRPVQEVYNRLKNSKSERARVIFLVLERHFINKEPVQMISTDLKIPARTLYRRIRELHGLVYAKCEELGILPHVWHKVD